MDKKRSLPRSLLAAASLASTIALAGFLPGSAATAKPVTPIQHVVVIYLENHSFDNVLGYWCNANPRRCPDGGMPSSVTLSNGATVRPSITPDTIPPIYHSVASQLAAMNITRGKPADERVAEHSEGRVRRPAVPVHQRI